MATTGALGVAGVDRIHIHLGQFYKIIGAGIVITSYSIHYTKLYDELFNLRFQSATGQLENHGRLKAVKRDIARIYTIMRERELGIRTAPTAKS